MWGQSARELVLSTIALLTFLALGWYSLRHQGDGTGLLVGTWLLVVLFAVAFSWVRRT